MLIQFPFVDDSKMKPDLIQQLFHNVSYTNKSKICKQMVVKIVFIDENDVVIVVLSRQQALLSYADQKFGCNANMGFYTL